jgi:hypothetical protein
MECDMENGQLREDDVTDISCATGVAVSEWQPSLLRCSFRAFLTGSLRCVNGRTSLHFQLRRNIPTVEPEENFLKAVSQFVRRSRFTGRRGRIAMLIQWPTEKEKNDESEDESKGGESERKTRQYQ